MDARHASSFRKARVFEIASRHAALVASDNARPTFVFAGGIGCMNAGHSAPRVVERARAQLNWDRERAQLLAAYEHAFALDQKMPAQPSEV